MPQVKFTWGPGRTARKCNRDAAYHKTTARALKKAANQLASKAQSKLAAHHHTGAAEINVTRGKLDYYVNLDDSRGQSAAAAIEFGHIAKNGHFVEGVHALTGGLK